MKLDGRKVQRLKSLLSDARKLIANKKRWCQGYLATNSNGEEVNVTDNDAAKFCALGAIQKVGKQRHFSSPTVQLATEFLTSVCEEKFGVLGPEDVNDDGFQDYRNNPKSNKKTIEKAHKNVLEAFKLASKKVNLNTAKELS